MRSDENPQEIQVNNLASARKDDSITPYWDGNRYKNFRQEPLWWQFFQTIYSLFPGMFAVPTSLPDLNVLCIDNPPLPQETKILGSTLSWLGHSTVYLRTNGFNILFDPTTGDVRPSPDSRVVLYKRYTKAPFVFSQLPVNIIFLSHNHEDHARTADLQEFAQRNPQPFVIAGTNSSGWLQSLGFRPENIKTMSWWDQCRIINRTDAKTFDLLGVPAFHSSQPKQWTNQNQTKVSSSFNYMLWLGFVLQILEGDDKKTIYFSGDTAIGTNMEDRHGHSQSLFDQIHTQVPQIDIACIEVSPEGEPESHLGSDNALNVLKILGPTACMPMHHSCFRSDLRRVEDAIIGFMSKVPHRATAEEKEKSTAILPLKIGAQISINLASQQPLHPDISNQFIPSSLWANNNPQHVEPPSEPAGFQAQSQLS